MKDWIKTIKKLSKIKKAMLVIITTIVFLGIAWLGLFATIYPYFDSNEQTVDMVLRDISYEDYDLAYNKFSERYKKEEKLETFRKGAEATKDLIKNYEPNSFKITHSSRYFIPIDQQTLVHRGEISLSDGSVAPITAVFIWENDAWKLYLLE